MASCSSGIGKFAADPEGVSIKGSAVLSVLDAKPHGKWYNYIATM